MREHVKPSPSSVTHQLRLFCSCMRLQSIAAFTTNSSMVRSTRNFRSAQLWSPTISESIVILMCSSAKSLRKVHKPFARASGGIAFQRPRHVDDSKQGELERQRTRKVDDDCLDFIPVCPDTWSKHVNLCLNGIGAARLRPFRYLCVFGDAERQNVFGCCRFCWLMLTRRRRFTTSTTLLLPPPRSHWLRKQVTRYMRPHQTPHE